MGGVSSRRSFHDRGFLVFLLKYGVFNSSSKCKAAVLQFTALKYVGKLCKTVQCNLITVSAEQLFSVQSRVLQCTVVHSIIV